MLSDRTKHKLLLWLCTALMLFACSFYVQASERQTLFQDFEGSLDVVSAGDNAKVSVTSERFYTGTKALKYEVKSSGDPETTNAMLTIDSGNSPVDVSDCTHLVIWLYDTQGSNTLKVGLIDKNGVKSSLEWKRTQSSPNGGTIHNHWTEYSIPMSDFSGVDKTAVSKVVIGEWNQGVYYVDNIAFTSSLKGDTTGKYQDVSFSFDLKNPGTGDTVGVIVQGLSDSADYDIRWYADDSYIRTSKTLTLTDEWKGKTIRAELWTEGNFVTEQVFMTQFESNLPICYIDTENGAAITSKENYVQADLKIVGNSQFSNENNLYDSIDGEDAPIEIRGRGNVTWTWGPKKPYKIKLGTKKDLFGMGKNKHWVLLANYKDYSFMKNKLAYDLSGALGMPYIESTWVEVVLNGEYVGTYQFAEQVRVDSERVDVFDWEGLAEDVAKALVEKSKRDALEAQLLEHMEWITTKEVIFENTAYDLTKYADKIQIPDYNGGFLLENDDYWDEISKWQTAKGKKMNAKNPEYLKTNPQMFSYIQNYVQAIEDAVYADNFYTSYEGTQVRYTDLLDFDSSLKYWLVNEIFCNMDAGKNSTYLYKDVDQIMYMGPVWDMDYGAGGQNYEASQSTSYWHTTTTGDVNYRNWFAQMVRDPYFLEKAMELYKSIRPTLIADMLENVDTYYNYLSDAGKRDFSKWWPSYTYQGGVNNFKRWLTNRINWLDRQFTTIDTLTNSFGNYGYKKQNGWSITLYEGSKEEILQGEAFANADIRTEVTFSSDEIKEAEYYVNGIYAGKVTVSDRQASLTLPARLFTEPHSKNNTIQIYGKSTDGKYAGSNYAVLIQKDEQETESESESESETQSESETETQSENESESETQSESQSETETQSENESTTESESSSDSNHSSSGAATEIVPVTSVSLGQTEITLNPNSTFRLSLQITPVNASSCQVTWKSSDHTVAAVDKDGKVTAYAAGDAIITITLTQRDGLKKVTETVIHVVPEKMTKPKTKRQKNGSVKLTWLKQKNVSGYEIYRSYKRSKGYKKIKTITKKNTISFLDKNVKRKTAYYKIRTYKKVNGEKVYGEYSNTVKCKKK